MQTENPDQRWSGLFISKILCESIYSENSTVIFTAESIEANIVL